MRGLTDTARFESHVTPEPTSGCLLWTGGVSVGGYGKFTLAKDSGTVMAHRWAWEQVHGAVPQGRILRHKCDQPARVNVNHLTPGTHAENSHDMTSRQRQARGERCRTAKLLPSDVRAIRIAHAAGAKPRTLAALYEVRANNIWFIVNRKTWKHID